MKLILYVTWKSSQVQKHHKRRESNANIMTVSQVEVDFLITNTIEWIMMRKREEQILKWRQKAVYSLFKEERVMQSKGLKVIIVVILWKEKLQLLGKKIIKNY